MSCSSRKVGMILHKTCVFLTGVITTLKLWNPVINCHLNFKNKIHLYYQTLIYLCHKYGKQHGSKEKCPQDKVKKEIKLSSSAFKAGIFASLYKYCFKRLTKPLSKSSHFKTYNLSNLISWVIPAPTGISRRYTQSGACVSFAVFWEYT